MLQPSVRILALILLGLAFPARASDEIDHAKSQLKGAESVQEGSAILGEQIDLATGGLQLHYVDVDLPTNSGLKVQIGRRLETSSANLHLGDNGDYYEGVSYGFEPSKDHFGTYWELDIPYMTGLFDTRKGWTARTNISDNGLGSTSRCTLNAPPPYSAGNWPYYYSTFSPDQYWNGVTINVPGAGREQLLTLAGAPQLGADGINYYATTRSDWRVSCLTALKNGTGEGYRVVLPNGVKYTFDWMASHRRPSLTTGPSATVVCSPNTGCPDSSLETVLLPRTQVYLYVTRVEDRFGNYVTYDYDPAIPTRLRSITASDGVSLAVNYDANGQVATVTSGTRTWTYQYNGTATFGKYLSDVVLPDASRWQYTIGDLFRIHTKDQQSRDFWMNCAVSAGDMASGQPIGAGDSVQVSVKAPSGLTGVFKLRKLIHGTNNTPGGCTPNQYNGYPRFTPRAPISAFEVASVYEKVLSGPGIAGTPTWQYMYYPTWSWASVCATTACANTSQTMVTDPTATVTRYTFGNDYQINSGQLLDVAVESAGVTKRRTTTTYMASATGQPFPDAKGTDLNSGSNPLAAKNRPFLTNAIQQDGATFNLANEVFDSFVRATQVRKWSTGMSTNYTATETTVYSDNQAKWVLGQVAKTTRNGIVTHETGFDATTALALWTKTFGKLVETRTYNANGTVATAKDGRNYVTTFTNWKRGIPQTVQFPATAEAPTGATRTVVVDDAGWIASATDEIGHTTSYTYDPVGRIKVITHPTGDAVAWNNTLINFAPVATAEYGIAAGHWKRTEQTGYGLTTTYYDAMWRPVLVQAEDTTKPASRTYAVQRYDALGHQVFGGYPVASLASVADSTLGVRATFDAIGRVSKVEQDSELGVLTTTTQYLGGFKTKVTNPRLFSTTTGYQAYDVPSTDAPTSIVREIKLSPLETATTALARDTFGKPKSLQRSGTFAGAPVSSIVSYVYDANEELCKIISPESGATFYATDAAFNLAWTASGSALTGATCDRGSVPLAERTVRGYDARNRLLSVDVANTTDDLAYTYFANGTLKTFGNGPIIWSYAYNKRRMPLTETLTIGTRVKTATHAYNSMGMESRLDYPSGLSVQYLPDGLGLPTKAGNYASAVTYHPTGGMAGFTYGNGIVHSMTLNARMLPERSRDVLGTTAVLDDSYDFDFNGNVAAITDGVVGGAGDRTMTYDGLDRLLTTGAPKLSWISAANTYDPLDNLRSNKVGSRTYNYAYDASNRLSQLVTPTGTIARTFTYDAQGNILVNGASTNTFDRANRLTGVVGKETYLYDGHGRRAQITRTSDGKVSYPMYLLNGQLLMEEDQRSGKTTDYVYLNGSLVAKRAASIGTTSWGTTYIHTDALGSPVTETGITGTVYRVERYTPYGEPTDGGYDSGPGFTGHVTDSATGLSYMQQRYYDPVIGRFLSADPVAANPISFNRYWYANSNPYRFKDPDGRAAVLAAPIVVVPLIIVGAYIIYENSKSPEQKAREARNVQAWWDRLTSMNESATDNGQSDPASAPAPALPTGLVGDETDPRAGPNSTGKRHTSGNLLPEHGGTGDYETDLETLAGPTRPAQPGDRAPPGSQIGENGVFGRPINSTGGKSIDIPANGDKPHETLHYD